MCVCYIVLLPNISHIQLFTNKLQRLSDKESLKNQKFILCLMFLLKTITMYYRFILLYIICIEHSIFYWQILHNIYIYIYTPLVFDNFMQIHKWRAFSPGKPTQRSVTTMECNILFVGKDHLLGPSCQRYNWQTDRWDSMAFGSSPRRGKTDFKPLLSCGRVPLWKRLQETTSKKTHKWSP